MWIRSDDKKKIRRASADIINEVNKFKSIGDLDEKKQEEAMRLIKAAEQLKEIKLAWATTEASIQEAGGAGCLSCVSCRHQFTDYANWKRHRCPLSVPTVSSRDTFRVVSEEEEEEFKTAMESATMSMKYTVCLATKVCVPGVFPLIFLPQGYWGPPPSPGWVRRSAALTIQERNLKSSRKTASS